MAREKHMKFLQFRAAATVGLVLTVAAAQAQAPSAAELAAMKAEYRRPAPLPVENRDLADLGRLLFWDPRVSASGNTACATCHQPDRGWSVAEARSRNDSGKLTARKSQPLLGLGHVPHGMPDGTGATPRSRRR
jgi:cytochrome c peroxidase